MLQDQGKRFFLIEEEQLRSLILEFSPLIHRDTERMSDRIRELVALEREKLEFDNPRGTIELYPNKEKNDPAQPDVIGAGKIAGHFYRAAGWISKTDTLRIALLPRKAR